MRILFLDDDLTRWQAFRQKVIGHNVQWVSTSAEAIGALAADPFDLVYLDHDLDEECTGVNGDGLEVACWMAHPDNRERYRQTTIVVHSLNHEGASNMAKAFHMARMPCTIWPWGWLDADSVVELECRIQEAQGEASGELPRLRERVMHLELANREYERLLKEKDDGQLSA